MPRRPRLHVPGAHYHVTLRGNHREPLFDTPADRLALNALVGDALDRYGARIHAFCWMTNHIHALIQVADRPLGAVVQRIARGYSRHRHRLLGTTGHLFERRYQARLIDADAYFVVLLRYIHRNPVAAGIVRDPGAYPWSSHRAYLGSDSLPWLTTGFGLSFFGPVEANARAVYRRYVLDEGDDGPDVDAGAHPDDPRVMGSDDFLGRLAPGQPTPRGCVSLEALAAAICAECAIPLDAVRSPARSRRLTPVRLRILREAIARRAASLAEVARFLGRDPSTLCQLAAKHGTIIQ